MDATSVGASSTKVKALIACAIAIHVRCDGCLFGHGQAVLDDGTRRQEVTEMIGIAIVMGGGQSTVQGEEALQAYDPFAKAALTPGEKVVTTHRRDWETPIVRQS